MNRPQRILALTGGALRSPLGALFLAGALAGCGSPEAPSESVLVDSPVSLWAKAPARKRKLESRESWWERAFLTKEVLVLGSGESVRFAQVGLPAQVRLELDLTIDPNCPVPVEKLSLRIALHDAEGQVERQTFPLEWKLEEGREWLDVALDLEAQAPIHHLGLVVDTEPALPPPNVIVGRPVAWVEREVPVAPEADRAQVILLTLDTMRADILGAYGREGVHSENIDALADDGVLFEHCMSTANVTKPAHASIFTSLYLKDHQVVNNDMTLAGSTPTLMESLRVAGLRTAAVVSAINFSPKYSDLPRRFEDFYACRVHQRRGEDVTADAFHWLDQHATEDFFLWLHYFDVHAPYEAPYPFNRLHRTATGETQMPRLRRGYDFGSLSVPEYRDYLETTYKNELAYLDFELGRLFDRLRTLGIYERAMIVLTADHGEAFGELDVYAAHSGLSDANTHIPLIIKPLGSRAAGGPRGKRVAGLVSGVDIYPTLFDYLDLEIPHPVRGVSLRPLMEGGGRSEREFAFSEHAHNHQASLRTPSERLILDRRDHPGHKGFTAAAGTVRLFDYAEGRAEENDLAPREAERTARYLAELEAFLEDRYELDAVKIEDPEFLEALEALGYTAGE